MLPKVMVESLMKQIEIWLNAFPALKNLEHPSPAMIVRGNSTIDYRTPTISFGTYVMVYVGTDNTMETRSVPAISLQ